MNSKTSALRARLNQPGLVVAPGVFDMVSLRLADSFGFDALYMTGYGTVASHMGLPDAGLATLQRHGRTRHGHGGHGPHPLDCRRRHGLRRPAQHAPHHPGL